MPHEEAWAREQATVDACRLVRRRGWWMILFGFVHGIFFSGDIIGAYGLVAVLFADCLARKQYTLLYSAGAFITLLVTANFLVMGFASQDVSLLSDSQAGQAVQVLPWSSSRSSSPLRSSVPAWPTPASSPSRIGIAACSSRQGSAAWLWGRSRRSTAL